MLNKELNIRCSGKITAKNGRYLTNFEQIYMYLNIYIARAKSVALDNIKSLFKQNIKSGNAKRRRQRRRTVKDNSRSN